MFKCHDKDGLGHKEKKKKNKKKLNKMWCSRSKICIKILMDLMQQQTTTGKKKHL